MAAVVASDVGYTIADEDYTLTMPVRQKSAITEAQRMPLISSEGVNAVSTLGDSPTSEDSCDSDGRTRNETVEALEVDSSDKTVSEREQSLPAVGESAEPETESIGDARDDEIPLPEARRQGFWTAGGIALHEVAGRLHGTVSLGVAQAAPDVPASSAAISVLIDDLLGAAASAVAIPTAALRLEVDFMAPVARGESLSLTTWITHCDERRVYAAAVVSARQRVVAQGHGVFYGHGGNE